MFIEIDKNRQVSIKKQLYDRLTTMIIEGTLSYQDKLPSTRQLSEQLNIARNTVIEIYEQLTAEGYLVSIIGKGTYVSKVDTPFKNMVKKLYQSNDEGILNEKAHDIASVNNIECIDLISFEAGHADQKHFPTKQWLAAIREFFFFYNQGNILLDYGNPKGFLPLRKEIRSYLKKHKGIQCEIGQILITSGTSGALNTIAITMKQSISQLITESFVMDFVPNIFGTYEYDIKPVEVDEWGLSIEALNGINNIPRSLIYTSPSHQFPLGGTMPIDRRQKLIEYAAQGNHIIIEDDYDSEFKYHGSPVNAIHQLGTDQVIYLGTFSKTLAPGIRIGYMIIPKFLVSKFEQIYELNYKHVQVMDQYVISRLMNQGIYEKHIYKMTRIYKKKSAVLYQSLEKYFGKDIEILGMHSGLHVAVRFKYITFTKEIQENFKNYDIELDLLMDYAAVKSIITTTNTLILGYGHLDEKEIGEGVKRIHDAIQDKE